MSDPDYVVGKYVFTPRINIDAVTDMGIRWTDALRDIAKLAETNGGEWAAARALRALQGQPEPPMCESDAGRT